MRRWMPYVRDVTKVEYILDWANDTITFKYHVPCGEVDAIYLKNFTLLFRERGRLPRFTSKYWMMTRMAIMEMIHYNEYVEGLEELIQLLGSLNVMMFNIRRINHHN